MIRRVVFLRHGETAYNRLGLRCGGDVDLPLTPTGEHQARAAGEALRGLGIERIVAAPLLRTRRTAELVQEALPGLGVTFHPGLSERRLGAWNGLDVAATQAWIEAGQTPPGGESEDAFRRRVNETVEDLLYANAMVPLLVSSRGVARVLRRFSGQEAGAGLGNAAVMELAFPLPEGGAP
ncbi:histidine phosphatase family protein [Pararhodospirillum photometricum]|nr:histidine phosphatase family protein [Pararhodospirillum photometricum]